MLQYPKPDNWGKAWSLHRRCATTDSYGDPVSTYDMTNADYTAEEDEVGAVAWQSDAAGTTVQDQGELAGGTATGRIFDSSIAVSVYDRVAFDGSVWEVQSVDVWPSFRTVKVVRIQ